MTARQKEMAAIKEQIAKLEERLEYLSKIPDTIEDELLISFDDFPWCRCILNALYRAIRERLLSEGAAYEEIKIGHKTHKALVNPKMTWEFTVKDLISCKESDISTYRGVGKVRMAALKSWMEKHSLYFLGLCSQ